MEHAAPRRSLGFASADELDWDALYADLAPRIYNYFRYRLGSGADVEDLTARTFEKAWRYRAHYRADLAGFSTWLFKIAQNVGLDDLQTRRPQLPLDAARDLPAQSSTEQDAERESDLARLAVLTARLPERERELIALEYGVAIGRALVDLLVEKGYNTAGF